MQFPSRALTNQYISKSYQDVLQQYPNGDLYYVLDGLGNVVALLNSSSVGDLVVTSNMTASMSVASASFAVTYSYSNIVLVSSSFASASISASYAATASYVSGSSNSSVSASYAATSSISQLAYDAISSSTAIVSIYSDTASIAIYSDFAGTASYVPNLYPQVEQISSSWASSSLSSSIAKTASYALNGGGVALTSGSTYQITSSWTQNALTASYIAIMPSGSTESASYAQTASYALNAGSSGLSIPSYDYSNLTYTGPLGQVSDCTYKIGGSGGNIVCIVTALYSGSIFIGVSKSLG